MSKFWRVACLWGGIVTVSLCAVVLSSHAFAADNNPNGTFSLQVSPSPLVTTVKPGVSSTVDLKIRNAGTGTEKLKIEPRSFTISNNSSEVQINDTTPPDIARWVSFSQPTFSVLAGQTLSEHVTFQLPKDTGFSYSFALIISRQTDPKPVNGSRLIKGSVAVFTLVNIDRPGATRKLEVAQLQTDHRLYEFLPASISVTLKNAGNTIVQPYGNIFIQHGGKNPVATLPVNETRGYILPGTARTLSSEWSNGFPFYQTVKNADGSQSRKLQIDWSKVSNLRIGRYTAKLVAVYDDGNGHDVPIEGEVSFWVIPWRTFIVLAFVLTGLWFLQHWRNKRRTDKAVRRALEAQRAAQKKEDS